MPLVLIAGSLFRNLSAVVGVRVLLVASALGAANAIIPAQIVYAQGLSVPVGGLLVRGVATFTASLLLLGVARTQRMLGCGSALGMLIVAGDLVAFRLDPGGSTLTSGPLLLLAVFLGLRLQRRFDAERIVDAWPLIAGAGLALSALTLLPGLGHEVRGQHIGSILGANTAELGRVMVLVALALVVARGAQPRDLSLGMRLAPAGLALSLILLQFVGRDHGPLAVVVGGLGFAYALRFGRLRLIGASVGVLAALGACVILLGNLAGRATSVLEPVNLQHPGDNTTQLGSALLAAAWGGVTGTGPGRGLVLDPRAPADQATDFSLIVVTQEGGIISMLLVLAGWAVVLAWGWRRISRADSPTNMLVGGTVWGALTVQVLLVSGGVLSLVPHTGLTLPFVSGGASSALTVALVIAAVTALTTPRPAVTANGLPAAILPERPWWRTPGRLGGLAALVMLLIASIATWRIESIAARVNHNPSNPWVFKDSERRGLMTTTASGQVIQRTVHPSALDRVERLHLGSGDAADKALRAITGPAFGRADLPGISVTLGDVMRCGGSDGLALQPAHATSQAATGDHRRCDPAGVSVSLDPGLVGVADEALQGRAGAVVIGEADTGRILAVAGREPGDAVHPAPEVAFLDAVPPGSIFKTAIALTVPAGAFAPWRMGYRATDGTPVPGSYCGGTLLQSITASCNSAFASWAENAGEARLRELGRGLGLGSGRDRAVAGLPLAATSIFGDQRPTAGVVAASGIGQGRITMTAVDAMGLAATIAADGVHHAPRILDAVCSADGQRVVRRSQDVARRLAPAAAAQRTAAAMRGPLDASLQILRNSSVAGAKTGTAEVPARLQDLRTPAGNIAWTIAIVEPDGHRGSPLAVAAMILPTNRDPLPRGADDAGPVVARTLPGIDAYAAREHHDACGPAAERPTKKLA